MVGYQRPSPKLRNSRKTWIAIVAVVIAIHLAILLFFKPQYLSIFLTKLSPGEEGGTSFPAMDRPFTVVSIEGRKKETRKKREIIETQDVQENEKADWEDILNLAPPEALAPMGIKGESSRREGGGAPRNIKPKPLYIPWPKVPAGIKNVPEGRVKLKVLVNEKGEVLDVKLIEKLPLKKLNDIAVQAAYRVKFSPGLKNGRPATMWVELSIGFQPG